MLGVRRVIRADVQTRVSLFFLPRVSVPVSRLDASERAAPHLPLAQFQEERVHDAPVAALIGPRVREVHADVRERAVGADALVRSSLRGGRVGRGVVHLRPDRVRSRRDRAALDGVVVKRFPRGDEEVTVRLSLPDDETATDNIGSIRVIAPNGQFVQLADIATVENRLGFSVVRRQDGFREVSVTSDLDSAVITTPEAIQMIKDGGLQDIADKYNLRYRFDGRDTERAEAFADMRVGATMALVCIYIILAWVFSSWLLPLPVMIMIPFALIGAVLGHYVMGLTMTILSMFALIALAGIVVNNSIILVSTIERRMEESDNRMEAIISGAVDRLRPVILTSVTTICGLSTLMFETSLQAQFLIPMATTIVFGLGVTTMLVLFVVPSALAIGEDIKAGRRFIGRLIRRESHPAE